MNTFFISDKIIILISLFFTAYFIYCLKIKKLDKTKSKVVFLEYCLVIVSLLALYYLQNTVLIGSLLVLIGIIFGITTIFILKKYKLYDKKYNNVFIFLLIILIGLGYNLDSPYYLRQHDSRSFVNYQNGGDFGYIGYIFYNNSLPKGSPEDYWCFFNPPLFHTASALFFKIQDMLGEHSIDVWFENLQILSLIFASIFYEYHKCK